MQDVDISSEYKNYSASTRLSLEAWSGSLLDLGLVCTLRVHLLNFLFNFENGPFFSDVVFGSKDRRIGRYCILTLSYIFHDTDASFNASFLYY